jgi:hypothetical protein
MPGERCVSHKQNSRKACEPRRECDCDCRSGYNGRDGRDGHNGKDGLDGERGHRGHRGHTGPTGPSSIGPTGEQGPCCTGPTGDYGPTGSTGSTGPTGPHQPISHFLRVDSVYGNDASAALDPTRVPFLTINAALAVAVAGDEVFVYPGVYNEVVVVPSDVCLRGANELNTIIQVLNPQQAVSVVSLNERCRLEDFTIELSVADPADLGPYDCVNFLNGASVNAKVRVCKLYAELLSGSANINCVRSSGASSLMVTDSHAIRTSTLSVNSVGSLPARGILVNGPNRLVLRDTMVFASGSGSNHVAVETTDALAILSVKTCSIRGQLADVLQTAGNILLGATDLVTHSAPLSFNCEINPSSIYFGLLGFPGGNLTYYLPPGVIPIASVSTVSPYTVQFMESLVVFAISIGFTGVINNPDTVTFAIYKNSAATGLSITLNSLSPSYVSLTNVGVSFKPGDILDARLTTVGNPNAGTFTGKILTY